ncbi:hypothetical protein [Kingella kingae]|uniref:hypothetical protein n=1 Tax=Kingella kingae TaxID=504 RepID=UPI0003F9B237|nr:hypothetical protein [Kingella kingae]
MDLNKILREMSPQIYKLDAVKLLKLLYNNSLSDEINPCDSARVDATMLMWLNEKASHFRDIHQINADVWIDFRLAMTAIICKWRLSIWLICCLINLFGSFYHENNKFDGE